MTAKLPSSYSGSFEAYCRYASTFPILSQEEETRLVESAQYLDDQESAKKLILHNIRFVISITRSYTGYDLPLADLAQEGTVGLMKAIKRFDPHQNVRLVSFAVHWIKSEINEFVIKNTKISKIATTKAQRKLFFNLRKMRRNLHYLTKVEADDIANQLDVPVREVLTMDQRMSHHDVGFDAKTNLYVDEGLNFSDIHPDESSLIEEPAAEAQLLSRKTRALEHAVDKLGDRDKDIIVRRWLTDKKVTLSSLAEKYEVSPERIRQLEKKALKKMQIYFPLI